MNQQDVQQKLADDEIDLRELFSVIWQGKWLIIAVSFVFAVGSVFYALSLPDIYKSEALLAPVTNDNSMKIPGQLGGLAALAGVNLGGSGGDKTALAIEILKSRDFASRFIEENELYIPLMAAKGWSRPDNKLIINHNVYDESSQQWVRKVKAPYHEKPSVQEAFEQFNKLFSVNQEKTSGMVKLSVEHYSPYLAKDWIDRLVKAINNEMRQRELSEAERSIAYLNSQISQTNIADIRTMLFSLIEEQTKTVMLANVRDEYVLKTIDPAVVAEKKAKPARALMCILAVMLGGILSVLVVLARYFLKK